MTRTTPELTPPLQTSTPHQREDVWPLRMIWRAAVPIHSGSSVESVFEPGTLRPQGRDTTTRKIQEFPKTENRLRRDFIGIKANTEENREQIINLLKQKHLEFVLSEAYKDRPVKVLPIDIEIAEIVRNLEEKVYKIGRVSQMKNFKEKKPLPLYLIDVKKHGTVLRSLSSPLPLTFRSFTDVPPRMLQPPNKPSGFWNRVPLLYKVEPQYSLRFFVGFGSPWQDGRNCIPLCRKGAVLVRNGY
ncbi:hypothetical protein AVEN_88604-1 [Araneus ventricosus]|uniref:Pre-C2HC domain-containing protein n=1 Tax=Araneus ventricosus TaxID=182803 RepID=A0A4Y2FNG4_ARAVE|nr:hypothetical protein AVEN_88604-1 [Araneus ventricosus]